MSIFKDSRNEPGLELGGKEGNARGAGGSASGGKSSRKGTREEPGVEESETFDPQELSRDPTWAKQVLEL